MDEKELMKEFLEVFDGKHTLAKLSKKNIESSIKDKKQYKPIEQALIDYIEAGGDISSIEIISDNIYPPEIESQSMPAEGKDLLIEFLQKYQDKHPLESLSQQNINSAVNDNKQYKPVEQPLIEYINGGGDISSIEAIVSNLYPTEETNVEVSGNSDLPETITEPRSKGIVSKRVPANSYTRFEKARIVGSRAIQISFGAPVFVEGTEGLIDPVDIALLELEAGVVPISVKYD